MRKATGNWWRGQYLSLETVFFQSAAFEEMDFIPVFLIVRGKAERYFAFYNDRGVGYSGYQEVECTMYLYFSSECEDVHSVIAGDRTAYKIFHSII